MVQTSLPMVREVLERQKAATGQFDYDDLITGVAQARSAGEIWSRRCGTVTNSP